MPPPVAKFVYVASLSGNSVTRCNIAASDGTLTDCTATLVGMSNPFDLCHSSTYMWVSYTGGVGVCAWDSATGALSACVPGGGATAFGTARGIAYFAGRVYVTVAGVVYVCEVATATGALTCAQTPIGVSFNQPLEIAFFENAFAFVIAYGTSEVYRCAANPGLGALSACVPAITSGLSNLQLLTVNNGYLYIAGGLAVTKCTIASGTGDITDCAPTSTSAPYDIVIANGYAYTTNPAQRCLVDAGTGDLSSCVGTGTDFNFPIGLDVVSV